jgi:hypothetical protein
MTPPKQHAAYAFYIYLILFVNSAFNSAWRAPGEVKPGLTSIGVGICMGPGRATLASSPEPQAQLAEGPDRSFCPGSLKLESQLEWAPYREDKKAGKARR